MKFEEILGQVKEGRIVTNLNWNGKNMWIRLQRVDAMSMINNDYIVMENDECLCIPWLPSVLDLFSSGWVVIE